MTSEDRFLNLLKENTSFRLFESVTNQVIEMPELLKAVEVYRNLLRTKKRDLAILHFVSNSESVIFYLAALLEGNPLMLIDSNQLDSLAALTKAYKPGLIFSTSLKSCYLDTYSQSELNPSLKININESEPDLSGCLTALLLGTSGSTGSPKFVQLSLDSVIANAEAIAASLDIQKTDIAVTTLPLYYSYGLSVLNSHLIAGGGVMLTELSIMESGFWELVNKNRVTSIAGVPYLYQMLYRLGSSMLERAASISKLTQAGGRLAPNLISFFHTWAANHGKRFYVMYGQTEACARMSCLQHADIPNKLGSVGKAIPGGAFRINDMDPNTKIGEIVYSGPNVMRGYSLKREDLLNENMLNGILNTGDLGYLDSEGFLFITGRLKRIAKIAGVRISLDEVETFLLPFGNFVAIAVGDQIKIFTTVKTETFDVKKALATKLNVHPSFIQIIAIEDIPRTVNGKIDYKALEK